MKNILLIIPIIFSSIVLLLKEVEHLMYTLLVFIVIDYLTGVFCAIVDKKVSSEIGFKGIFRKMMIFIVIGVAYLLDKQMLGNTKALQIMVSFFYLSNEGISILENLAYLGVPIPEKLKLILYQLKNKGHNDE